MDDHDQNDTPGRPVKETGTYPGSWTRYNRSRAMDLTMDEEAKMATIEPLEDPA